MFDSIKSTAVHSAILLIAILVCSCGLAVAQDVKYNFAAGTDFTKYKTYKWGEVKGAAYPDSLINDQIKAAVDSQLASKGLTKTDSGTADLNVAYQIAVSQETQWDAMGMGGSVRWGRTGTATSSTINIGTLVVAMFDVSTQKVVWRGDATKTLNPSKDPAKNQQNLQKAIAKLLKNYPPPVKK